MSKKLLEESTIRSFMKLANLQPLSQKFISENYGMKTEEELEEGEALEEEEEVEEAADLEEGKESENRPASKREAPKGTSLTGKPKPGIDGAESVKSPGKLKPLKTGTHHSVGKGNVSVSHETGGKSNASDRKPNRGEFEVVSESLEEMAHADEGYNEEMDAPEGEDTGGGAESGPHKDKMKDIIRSMLDNLKQMGEEYGMTMEISDEGGAPEAPEGGEEMAPPEGEEGMMQEKLDEMVEKLTKRVAARLVKESKKRR